MDERDLLETSIDIQKYVTAKRDEIYRAIEEECWKQLDDMRLINLYKGCRKEIDLRRIRHLLYRSKPMSNKYIIRNCPAYNEKGCLYAAAIFPDESMQNSYITFAVPCQDCTDCVMKQIVELAKGYKEELIDRKTKKVVATRYFKLTKEILELLDIQECE